MSTTTSNSAEDTDKEPILTLREDALQRIKDPNSWIPFFKEKIMVLRGNIFNDPVRTGYWREELRKTELHQEAANLLKDKEI